MKIEVVESYAIDGDLGIIRHSTPTLLFTNHVDSNQSIVSIKGTSIDLMLDKAEKGVWNSLVVGKFFWIKINPDSIYDEEDDRNERVDVEQGSFSRVHANVEREFLSDDSVQESDDESFGGNNPEDMKDLLLS